MQSLTANGGHATYTLERCCSPHKPSPEPTLQRAGKVHPLASMLWHRLAPGGRWADVAVAA
jgi:hypothetical protein